MRARGGLVTEKDLATYRPKWREPVRDLYRGWTVWSAPPPSSGGGVLVAMLNVLGGFPKRPLDELAAHRRIETARATFRDRAEFYGDPDFVSIPLQTLLSKKRADAIRTGIAPRSGVSKGMPAREGGQTLHLSVIDAKGGAVALTTTLNFSFGGGDVAGGVLMNDEMDDFATRPGRPNGFGLVQGERNAVAPGKRPLSSMTPTIAVGPDGTVLATGAPGGPTIISSVLSVLTGVIDEGLGVEAAVARPRLHHQWLPDFVEIESPLLQALKAGLAGRGHKVAPGMRFGAAHSLLRRPDGAVERGPDARYGR